MKIRLAACVVVAGAALATAAILSGSAESSTENRLRIAYFPNIGHVIPIVGIENGFFADHIGNGTMIETRLFDSGPQVIESLFAGSVDVAYVGPGPAINGFLNSEDGNLQILSGAASGGASFVVHPSSDIATISDFAGKRIAAPQIGNTQDVSLRHLLNENGMRQAERGGDVTIYNIPNPDIYTLFVKGEIDGAWVAEPWASILEMELGGVRLFHEEELWPDGRFASVLMIGNSDYARKNPDTIRSLLASHTETALWINQNPDETRDIFNGFMEETYGQRLQDDIVDLALASLEVTTDPIENSIHEFAERADRLGYLGRNGYDLSGIFYRQDAPHMEDGA